MRHRQQEEEDAEYSDGGESEGGGEGEAEEAQGWFEVSSDGDSEEEWGEDEGEEGEQVEQAAGGGRGGGVNVHEPLGASRLAGVRGRLQDYRHQDLVVLCRHAKRPSDLGFADELPGRFGGLSFDGSILFPESVTPAVRPPTPPARPPTPPPCEPGSFLTAGGLRALWQRSRCRLVDAGVTEAPRPEGVEMGSMRACLTET